MTDESEVNYLQPTRRRVLRMVSGLTALGVSSVVTSSSVAADPGDQLWAFETGGDVRSSPTVVDGTVFVGSFDSNLYAVDAETGEEEWAFETDGGTYSSPTVVDGTVFVGSFDSNLYAVDAETGQEEWAFETDGGIFSSPTVVDGTVFVGSRDGNLYAVDAETGTEEWAFETDRRVRSSPTVVDGTIFVGSDDDNLYAVEAETGTEEWAFETDRRIRSSPTVVDGTVFVGSYDTNLYAVDAETGSEEWAFETDGGIFSSPTVVDGTVFVGNINDNLYAVDAETGQEEWGFETGVNAGIFSSPTAVDETVFVDSRDDNLYAVDAETGQEEWAFETGGFGPSSPTVVDGTRFVSISSPTVVDGTVFVGSRDNNLYAVDAGVSGSSEGSRTKLGTLGHHGDLANTDQSPSDSQQETGSEGLIPSVGAVSPPTLIVAGGGVVGAGMYAWRRSRQTGEDTATDTTTGATDTTTSNPPSDSATEDATEDSDPQERATELLTQAEEAEANGAYQQAADAYEEAITYLEQATAGKDDDDESKAALKAEVDEIQESLEVVTAVVEARESAATTLKAAEQSFKEGIARYAANEQTVARIRFRQARDAFGEAQQTIDDSDAEVLAQPIEVSFEQEATLPSMAVEDLAVLDKSTVETLAAVDIESIIDLEADPESEEVTPAVVSDLTESDELSSEETALLTILSWWYEGASREFTSERVISRRYEQADYGFNQST